MRRGKRTRSLSLKIFSTNAASLVHVSKQYSLKRELQRTKSAVFTVQETCFKRKGTFQVKDFVTFEAIRSKEKGGTIIGAHKSLSPVLISEYSTDFELLVVEICVNKKQIRIISGVGIHETKSEDIRMPFFMALDEEINKAELEGKSVFIEIDANSKLGPERIPGDIHSISPNGRVLADIIDRHALFVANGSTKCSGLITRKRTTTRGIEESSIDIVMTSFDLMNNLVSLHIDDERKHVLTKVTKTEKVESDHNVLVTELSFSWDKSNKKEKNEIYNLKNKKGQAKFKEMTSNSNYLSSVFDDESEDFNTAAHRFIKRLNRIINKCFNKIRITERTDKYTEDLYDKWRKLQGKEDKSSKDELEKIEKELGEKIAQNAKKIEEEVGKYKCEDGGFNSGKLWNLKKHLFPRHRDPPTAMMDEEGKLLTSSEEINELALRKLGFERLKNRPMKKGLEEMKEKKEKLCEENLKKAQKNKTPDWSEEEVKEVLKNLKKNVSRDPLGYANEIFHPKVAGDDLTKAITKLVNLIKKKQIFPRCLELCNISSIWKRKGKRNTFDSYRGVFRVCVFRNILDRLIYNDEYSNVDSNLTDCNVGSRKFRNIRDHIFVMNAILNSVVNGDEEPLDCQVYDVEKCHDSLWLHEVINDLFSAGFQNDKLSLLFLENSSAQIAIKTSSGISRRITIRNLIMQGTVWANLCCTVLMDKLGKMMYENPDLLYKYKGSVPVPCLQMVDDVMVLSKCSSSQSVQCNSVVNSFMDTKKLSLSKTKCHNVHIGNVKANGCSRLKVHNSPMLNETQVKYLGDQVNNSGQIKATIDERRAKAFGLTSEILSIANNVPLGQWRIQSGLMLRQAMLVNGTLYNSECWQGLDVDSEILGFAKPDEALLRGLVFGHSKVPLEFLFLETGSVPVPLIHACRRMVYLHTILRKERSELVSRIYQTQKTDSLPGDFYRLVRADMEKCQIQLSDVEISNLSAKKYKFHIKQKVLKYAFEILQLKQKSHSKIKHIQYKQLKIQPYMKSPLFNKDDISTLFALRSRTVRSIRNDFKEQYKPNLNCPVCGQHLDSLPELLTCPRLKSEVMTLPQSDQQAIIQTKYEDIFDCDLRKQKQATQTYTLLLTLRQKVLNDSSSLIGTPSVAEPPVLLPPEPASGPSRPPAGPSRPPAGPARPPAGPPAGPQGPPVRTPGPPARPFRRMAQPPAHLRIVQ